MEKTTIVFVQTLLIIPDKFMNYILHNKYILIIRPSYFCHITPI